MPNPSAWAEAVEAMVRPFTPYATRPSGCECSWLSVCEDRIDLSNVCPCCRAAMLRAALPHLLRGIVEGMSEGELNSTQWVTVSVPGGLSSAGKVEVVRHPEKIRTALLAALTDAAGRVGG